ncbi:SpoIIE family protein phosphatase [Streptomyces sp. NPDC006879]|uniref:SpoIIE family protein phosphatase n=1 Tax=Streptomyces sp. NPDC006879 TaxID=3364767 RepID=UPI0036CA2345
MSWYGVAGRAPLTESEAMTERPHRIAQVPDGLPRVLAQAGAAAITAIGGYAGALYLRSESRGLLRLAILIGLPGPLFRPWWRMHANRPFPIAETYRTGHAIHLANAEEGMRRFPQLMASLPYPFGSHYMPVFSGPDKFGVLVTVGPARPGSPVVTAEQLRLHRIASGLADDLDQLASAGTPVRWDGPPVSVRLPAPGTPPARTGRFAWDLDSGAVAVDAGLCTLIGSDPARPPGTIDALTAHWFPDDVLGLWATARQATDAARPPSGELGERETGEPEVDEPGVDEPENPEAKVAASTPVPEQGAARRAGVEPTAVAAANPSPASHVHRIGVRGPAGRPYVLELWVDPPFAPLGESDPARRLTGLLMDLGDLADGRTGATAADLLPQPIVAADRLGLITYANDSAVQLLETPRGELLGHALWDALPWLAHPAYEDHFRSVLLTSEPVHFLARRGTSEWLSVSLYPGREGLTATLATAEHPAYAPGTITQPGDGTDSPADRASALYRPVALAIALTEAVTARQVSAVVTDELLPAFGGRQLAIYLLNDRHLYLAWETGFPQGFLNRFDGVGLDAKLPGVETLTSGRPIFFESMEHLAAAYPGIPLDSNIGARAFLPLIASGRPVGSCILGFDRPRGFSPEERTVLTALAGLIAQALQRAQRYDTESAVARGLQSALLPHRLPVLQHVDTVGRYLPGTQTMEVGGDWYDVIETGRGLLALVIGDVQGHGVAAAATMGQLRSAVRAFALSGSDPQAVISGTNRLLIDLDPGQFASCCYILLDPRTGAAQAVRAGHPQPLLRHPDGHTVVLDLPGGVVLGVADEATYPVTELHLAPGDVLALFTDGLVENPGVDIDEGIEHLRRTLAQALPASLATTADRLISEAGQTLDRPDDIALLLAARWQAP